MLQSKNLDRRKSAFSERGLALKRFLRMIQIIIKDEIGITIR